MSNNPLPYRHIQEQTERQLLNIMVDKLCCISENQTGNNELKIAYYTEISSASGTITIPTGATILLHQIAGGASALVSTIDGTVTGTFPQTAGGVDVDVTSFDSSGNYVLSGTPDSYPVALIYWLKISGSDYPNLNIDNIIEEQVIPVEGDLDISGILNVSRNVADANPATIIEQTNAASTGDIAQFKNSTGTVAVFDNDGKLGIGTATPSEKLSVVGKVDLNDGGNSVFIGEGAGRVDDASDNRNVAIGYQALYLNTTGYRNTAIGFQALASNTTGFNNTANGYQALYLNTTGYYNTANGSFALIYNTTGDYNIANGSFALYSNTTGNRNTAIGHQSLYSNTIGGDNVAIGYIAGRYLADGVTEATNVANSLFLGVNTSPLADGQTNQTVIGYLAKGIGSNTVVLGNDNVVTTALKGNVGIGTTSPSAQIHADNTATTGVGAIIENSNAANTNDIVQFQNSTGTVAKIENDGSIYTEGGLTVNGLSTGTSDTALVVDNGVVSKKVMKDKTILAGNPADNVSASSTEQMSPIGSNSFNTINRNFIVAPADGTLSDLYIYIQGTQDASGSLVITLQINLVNTAMSITVPAGATSTGYSELLTNISVSAGDFIGFSVTNNATTNSARIIGSSLIFTFD